MLGAFTHAMAEEARHEWLMGTPAGAPVLPLSGCPNKRSLAGGAPALYRMVTERTGEGSRWLPSMMPDGAYRGPAAVFRLVPPNNASRRLGGGVIRRGGEG
mmetsp:Transcript_18233/g.60112  ORF Transcript_18233/g.60112 Transcript_18233/m.60112 type:complete len:101 (+) Transcript_18233:17-319(+)